MDPGPGPKPTDRERQEVRMGFRMMGIGFEAVSQVAAGLLLGFLWDKWRGTETGVVVGGAIGVLVGVISLVKSAWKLNAELDRNAARRRKGGPS
jgi:F0F1-type ATP synthase assembly protein I